MTAALGDEDGWVRSGAAFALGVLGDERVVGPLVRALEDWHPHVRWSAVVALGKLGDERAVPALERVRDTDSGEISGLEEIRSTAAKAIQRVLQPDTC